MKKKVFYNASQAYNYLVSSIIRLEKVPIFVVTVEAKGKDYALLVRNLGSDKQQTVLYSDERLNLNTVSLGFCNLKRFYNQVYYTYRLPARSWSIGLSATTFGVYNLYGSSQTGADLLTSAALARTIMNDYPLIEQAAKQLKKTRFEKECIAFSRNFALNQRMEVIYGLINLPIGEFNGQAFSLKDEYAYLYDLLMSEVDNA